MLKPDPDLVRVNSQNIVHIPKLFIDQNSKYEPVSHVVQEEFNIEINENKTDRSSTGTVSILMTPKLKTVEKKKILDINSFMNEKISESVEKQKISKVIFIFVFLAVTVI